MWEGVGMGKLTALSAKNLTKPGRHGDADGLYLNIAASGTKSWVQRMVVDGRRRDIGLGSYPAITLAQARGLAASNRSAVAEGRNPLSEKREARAAVRRPAQSVPTFAEVASSVIELRRPTWTNPKHAAQWRATLETYAFPVIGNMPVDAITASDSLAVLEPIWTLKPETASRVRQRMEAVMDWSVIHGYRLDNPAGRALLRVLPPVNRLVKHHEALPHDQVSGAFAIVKESSANTLTKLAFEFLVLTAARSGEVRRAEWSEVDWNSRIWEIPAIRMKARRPHRVPLSTRSIEVLKAAWEVSGPDGLIFPAGPGDRAASDMTFTALLRRLDIPAVPHGFRSSFRNWVEECTETPWSVAESALAHNIGNATQSAYMTSDLFEQRRELMERWARFVAGNCG
jgi:integrase